MVLTSLAAFLTQMKDVIQLFLNTMLKTFESNVKQDWEPGVVNRTWKQHWGCRQESQWVWGDPGHHKGVSGYNERPYINKTNKWTQTKWLEDTRKPSDHVWPELELKGLQELKETNHMITCNIMSVHVFC